MNQEIEFLNAEQRLAVILCLDVSKSVDGAPIAALNAGLQRFQHEVQNDPVAARRVDVSIITFGNGTATVVQDFVNITQFQAPTLTADGDTPAGAGIDAGFNQLKRRIQYYNEHGIDKYRSLMLFASDGQPTDQWQNAAYRVHQAEAAREVTFVAVGFGDVDMDTLTRIAPPNRPPRRLDGLKFVELFEWLSKSVRMISTSRTGTQLALPAPDPWTITTT
jgi:uncharacterized protein YegL